MRLVAVAVPGKKSDIPNLISFINKITGPEMSSKIRPSSDLENIIILW